MSGPKSDIFKLAELGWGADLRENIEQAILKYQEFMGLEKTGVFDVFTHRSLHASRFCSHNDCMDIRTHLPKWPNDGSPVTWCITSKFPNLTKDEAAQAYSWAMDQWNAVCGIDLRQTTNEKTADILVIVKPIDGQAGILAQSQLPNGARTQMEQYFDSAEPFVFKEQPRPFEVDIGRVFTHENGHVIGIPHLPAGSLMQRLYDPNIRIPKEADIAEAVERYGPPKNKAPEPSLKEFVIKLKCSSEIDAVEIPGFVVVKN